jgi:hypothetical protein
MRHIAIAQTETEKASREIEAEDPGTLAQLIVVSEGGTTLPTVGEARLESKGIIGFFEIVVAMMVGAMVVAISALLPLA